MTRGRAFALTLLLVAGCATGEFNPGLCDLMMPRMSGFDFHAALLAAVPQQAERMIFVTGGGFTSRGRLFLDEVSNLRVEKPFDAARLRSLVAQQLVS